MRTISPALMVVLVAACAGDPPAGPSRRSSGALPDLTPQAFRLVLDIANGRVEVGRPAPDAGSGADGLGPSFSLIGAGA
jgi:hypothetical protein